MNISRSYGRQVEIRRARSMPTGIVEKFEGRLTVIS